MDNSKSFRLEAAIAQWRARLDNSAALLASDVEELETHLRDAVRAHQVQGASDEVAFNLAIRQMGSGQELNREFAKTNWPQVWMDHVLWMAVGLIVAFLIRTSASSIGFGVKMMSASWAGTIGLSTVAVISYLSNLLVEFGLWYLLWRLVVREGSWVLRCARWCVRYPLLPMMGLLLLNLNFNAGWEWIMKRLPLAPNHGVSVSPAQLNAAMDYGFAAFIYARELIYLMGFAYLAVRYLRTHSGTQSPRQGNLAGSENQVLPIEPAAIWQERALWIVAAPVLFSTVFMPLTFVSPVVAALLSPEFPRSGFQFGVLELGLHWAGCVALFFGIYWLGARGARWSAWVKSFIAQKPISRTAGIALGLAAFSHLSVMGLGYLSSWVLDCDLLRVYQVYLDPITDPQFAVFYFRASAYCKAVWFQVLPVCLMFWLARKRAGLPLKDYLKFQRSGL